MSRHGQVDGLDYADDGDPRGEHAVVALHSLGADHRLWASQVEAFAAGAGRLLRPDTRGHGRSGCPDGASVDGWVADLDAVLAHADVHTVDLVGISMGGIQALAYAAANPHRVRSLVVLDSFARLDRELARNKLDGMISSARELGMPAFADRYVKETLLYADADAADDLRDALGGMKVDAFTSTAQACFTVDLTDRLGAVAAPTLVLWGENDQKAPRELSEAIVTALPDARLDTVPRAGHLANLDNPKEVTNRVRRFLSEQGEPDRRGR